MVCFQAVRPAFSAMSWKTMGPVLTKPPAVIGLRSLSRTGAWTPPVLTPPIAGGCPPSCGLADCESGGCCASELTEMTAQRATVLKMGLETGMNCDPCEVVSSFCSGGRVQPQVPEAN